jgi:YD repeat-containing protein
MKKDKEKTTINIKHFLALFFLIGISQAALCDDVQNALNLDYFRTPEASAFKKYGEELVNEYTGTADISVPLYTIKCKDIEIPLVLRYDASGIKVEQEASWVGLGWNLMVGGCINYVCAGAKDRELGPNIHDRIWTQYLTTINGLQYYNYKENDTIHNWMASLPYEYSFVSPYQEHLNYGDMRDYVEQGYGERDFYSVNILGNSFSFFVDPFTLKPYTIGRGGDEYKIETEPALEKHGNGRKERIQGWKITASDGCVYKFGGGDKLYEPSTGMWYMSCWYLSEIRSPKGEVVKFSYTQIPPHYGRNTRIESISIPLLYNRTYEITERDFPHGYSSVWKRAFINNYYLDKIIAGNQTVTFVTSNSNECSGRRLDAIRVTSYNDTVIKAINFSYSSFGYSNVGGNYAFANNETESENRLKLDNVKEVASSDTLTTSFSYNSLNLPSKRSCAQDYWGYYNGKENYVSGHGHSLVPAPSRYMSYNYTPELNNYSIEGADRLCHGNYMQAAMLNRVDYPTGGYTTYEYETNRVRVNTFAETQKYIEKSYDVSKSASFSVSENPSYSQLQMDSVSFWLNKELKGELYLRCSSSANIDGEDMNIYIFKWPTGGETSVSGKIIPAKFNRSQGFSYVDSITLSPGRYTLMVAPPNVSIMNYGATCQLRGFYTETLTDESEYYVLCGGLRIKKISNYDSDGQKINYTTYDYNNENGSTGILLNSIETVDSLHYKKFYDRYDMPNSSSNLILNFEVDADVYTITQGRSRLPEFYASCNPGIVGYSQVSKYKYNAQDELERSVVTTFKNEAPKNFMNEGYVTPVIDYYKNFGNGNIISQKILDANGNVVSNTDNTYISHLLDHYAVNMDSHTEIITGSSQASSYTGSSNPKTTIWRYPYILSREELSQSVTTEYCPDGSTIVKTKDYLYNGINHQVSQIDENTSLSDQTLRTKITYSADGEDYMSRWMKDAHRLNDVVENKTLLVENGQEHCISTQRTNYTSRYNNGTSHYLPASLSTSIGDNAPETRAVYSYDDSLNVRSVAVDGMETVYIWSYNSQYPIAKIEGVTYADVENALGASTLATLLRKPEPGAEDLMQIRNAINGIGGHVTTYTYKPLVGITSETLPNGNTVYYEYDSFGRLTRVIDHDGSVISTNSYNYRRP